MVIVKKYYLYYLKYKKIIYLILFVNFLLISENINFIFYDKN